MAAAAFNFPVLTCQMKLCVVVAELCGRLKLPEIVALLAVGRQRLLVLVFMAVQTVSLQAQEGAFVLFYFSVSDVSGFVAFIASQFGMSTLQIVSCASMVETLLVETDHLKFSSVVFAVTAGAFFTLNVFRNMVTLVLVNLLFKCGVTVEASFVDHFLTQFVALGTIGKAFQVGVCLRQIAG